MNRNRRQIYVYNQNQLWIKLCFKLIKYTKKFYFIIIIKIILFNTIFNFLKSHQNSIYTFTFTYFIQYLQILRSNYRLNSNSLNQTTLIQIQDFERMHLIHALQTTCQHLLLTEIQQTDLVLHRLDKLSCLDSKPSSTRLLLNCWCCLSTSCRGGVAVHCSALRMTAWTASPRVCCCNCVVRLPSMLKRSRQAVGLSVEVGECDWVLFGVG